MALVASVLLDNGSSTLAPVQDGLNSPSAMEGPSSTGSSNGANRNRRQLSIAVPANSDSQSYTVLEEGEATATTVTAPTATASRSESAAMDAADDHEQQNQQRAMAMESLIGKRPSGSAVDGGDSMHRDQDQHCRVDSGTATSSSAGEGENLNRFSHLTALSQQRSSLASTAQTSEACHATPEASAAVERNTVESSPSLEVTSPRSPGFGTYETQASGAVASQQLQPERSSDQVSAVLRPALNTT